MFFAKQTYLSPLIIFHFAKMIEVRRSGRRRRATQFLLREYQANQALADAEAPDAEALEAEVEEEADQDPDFVPIPGAEEEALLDAAEEEAAEEDAQIAAAEPEVPEGYHIVRAHARQRRGNMPRHVRRNSNVQGPRPGAGRPRNGQNRRRVDQVSSTYH